MSQIELIKLLRKCRICKLEAYSIEDLENFVKDKNKPYGRRNICKPCQNKLWSKGGKFWPSRKRIEKIRGPKRITFKGKRLRLKENPRTNVCSECGRQHPEELKYQTIMHHEIYDELKPLRGTHELCVSCHIKLHYMRGDLPITGYKKGMILKIGS